MNLAPSRLRRTLRALLFTLLAGCGGSNDVTVAPTAPPPREVLAPAPAVLATGRLPGTATPTRYALALVIDPRRDRFSGNVLIDVDVPRATSSIVLHGRGLTVLRAEVAAAGETVSAQATGRMAQGGKDTPEELILSLARPIPPGSAQIRVAYSGAFNESLSGLYRVRDGGESYVFTQLEPSDARRMFPCFDEPGFKVPFDLKVTTPKGNLVVANTRELSRQPADDGRSVTFAFAPTAPLPTYLVALGVGPLEIKEGAKVPVPIRVVTTKGKSHLGDLALDATSAMIELLGAYFDRPYPYDKLDILAVPEFGYGAMENAGLITFREETILLDPASASTEARRLMAENLAHEVSHHWFGNLVTMRWWDDLWLNEGFATWMEGTIVDQWRPELHASLERLTAKGAVMKLDALDAARAVRKPVTSTSEAEEAFDGIVYEKGAGVVDMLEGWLGAETFRAGVRAYVRAHEHGHATSDDLFDALGQASGRDVSSVARTFLEKPGVPLVHAALVCDAKSGGATLRLRAERYRARAHGEAERLEGRWKIPVCVSYDGATEPVCTLMAEREATLALPGKRCPRWVYPNARERGYYRVSLPQAGLAALVKAGRAVDVRERVGLVANAWALVQSDDLEADALLDLLAGMKAERSRLVLDQMIEVLRGVSDSLVDDASRPAFRAFVSSLLLPVAKELGWDTRKGDTDDQKAARRSVLEALATLADDRWMRAEADKRAARFLVAPRSIDADTAGIALRVSTRHAGEGRLAELLAVIAKAATPEDRVIAARALGTFESPQLLRRGLDAMLGAQLKVQDGIYVFDAANEHPGSRKVVLAWVRERFADLRSRMPGFVLTRFAGATGLTCDAAARDEAGAFFRGALGNVEGADRALAQAVEAAGLCIDLRAREGARAQRRLKRR